MSDGSSNRRQFLLQTGGAAGAMMIASPLLAQGHPEQDGPAHRSGHKAPTQATEAQKKAAMPPVPEGGKELSVRDGKLYYLDSGGDGEVILLLHAMTGSARFWEKQWPALTAAGYRVIAYSRRGHWGSSPINPEAPGTGAEDLKAFVDGLGIEKFHGVGTAGGAHYLMDFAVKWHSMLYSMTLACSSMAMGEEEFLTPFWGNIPPKILTDEFARSFAEMSAAYRAADPEGLARWEALEEIARYDRELVQPKMHGVTWEEIEGISAPAMLIAGGADLYITPTLIEMVASHFQVSETHVIPNVGHSAHWEDPETFNMLVLNFAARHNTQIQQRNSD